LGLTGRGSDDAGASDVFHISNLSDFVSSLEGKISEEEATRHALEIRSRELEDAVST
jgi:hypothetical protein